MTSKEATNLDNLLIIYTHEIELLDILLSTDYAFNFN